MKRFLALVLAVSMVFSLSLAASAKPVKIGISIWSSTDTLGSECKRLIDAAAAALGVETQWVDQAHISEQVTASAETLALAGCDGIIITDDLEMGATANHNLFSEVGVKAIQAGADIVLVCHEYSHEQSVYLGILEAVKRGDISEERINESVKRILRTKLNNIAIDGAN